MCECCRPETAGGSGRTAGQEKNRKTNGDPYKRKNNNSCTGKTGDPGKGAECTDRHTVSRSSPEYGGTEPVWKAACRNYIINETKTEYGTLPAGKRRTDRLSLCIAKTAIHQLSGRQRTWES